MLIAIITVIYGELWERNACVMYQLLEQFIFYDDNSIPYTLQPERHTMAQDYHAAIDERGFVLKSIGNRWILQTPSLLEFSFDTTMAFNFLHEYNPLVHFFFGYDCRTRCGQGLQFQYHLDGGLTIRYVHVNRMEIQVVGEAIHFADFYLQDDEDVKLSFSIKGTKLTGKFRDCRFSFIVDSVRGHLAFERKNFVGEWMIREFMVASNEDFSKNTIVPECRVEIPMREGGDIPYELTYKIESIGDQRYLFIELGGGAATRKLNREDRPGQYVAERDMLTSPFIILRSEQQEKRFNLFRGTRGICDPNIYWDCLKEYFNQPELPIRAIFPVEERGCAGNLTVSFGYEDLSCTGFFAQAGGPSEFIFDKQGQLIYAGDALQESVFELLSPVDKFATTLIPENTYRREAVLHHLAVNHYFHVDETISLCMTMKTRLPLERISVSAEIRDVYDSDTIYAVDPTISMSDWLFGYQELCAEIKSQPLPLGVFRVVFTVYYGDGLYRRFDKVFEVFDKDAGMSPAKASGLPFVFSMPNEQKWLMSNTFDLWNPKPSCDEIHFISCVTNTPIEAEQQRIWELIPLFGREWFAWLNDRTCLDWSVESHPNVVKYSDYLYIDLADNLPPYPEIYLIGLYQDPKFRELLHEFMEKNPELAEKITYRKPEVELEYRPGKPIDESEDSEKSHEYTAFTYEHLKNLLETCHSEWFSFANGRFLEMFRKQNEELKKLNPKFKRSFYGPFCPYYTGTVSYHSIKCYGCNPDETMAEDVFTGFSVFEDYPASCAYQTYRGAFAAMTILLHCPEFVLYPEQYKDGLGGCIDGAVKFAHAPMGKYNMPLYFNSTHAFEYVFNTPHKTAKGYQYWSKYGFHRADHRPEMADRLVRDWKTVIDNKPKRPLKTMAMLTEYVDAEDVFDGEIRTLHGYTGFSNVSEEGHGYIYDCVREAGLNAPFALKTEMLSELSEAECDVLVLPTLRYMDQVSICEIRRLHNAGVSLVAVSDVCGLEDIFGVKENYQSQWVSALCTEDEEELIYPNEAHFKYTPDGAEVILSTTEGMPVLMKKRNALLVNAAVSTLGHECFEGREGKTKNNISTLLRKIIQKELCKLSKPLVQGENIGVTLFESEQGHTQLLCIDYSAYDNQGVTEKEAIVKINMPILNVTSERNVTKVRNEQGYIEEIRFKILTHESVMFRLESSDPSQK